MSAMIGHCGLLLGAAAPVDPYWAQVKSLLIFDNGLVDAKDGTLWTTHLGSPAVEASTGWGGDQALRLHNATTDRIRRPLVQAANVPLTLEAWFYPFSVVTAGYYNGLFFVDDGTNTRGVSMTNGSGVTGKLGIINNQNQGVIDAGTFTIQQKIHAALIYDGNGLWKYYLNGNLLDAANQTGSIGTTQAFIGHSNTSWSDSTDAEFRAFRATAAVRYTGNFTPPPVPWPTA